MGLFSPMRLTGLFGVAVFSLALVACSPSGEGVDPASSARIESSAAAESARQPGPMLRQPAHTDELIELYSRTRLVGMTLEQKAAAVLMVHTPGTDAATWQAMVSSIGASGFILMGDNIPDSTAELAAATATLSAGNGLAVLVGIDEEGGVVARLPQDSFAAAEQLKSLPVTDTANAFAGRAELLAESGITLNFGVVADVTDDPSSFIYERVFGGDPDTAAARVAAAVAAEHGTVFSTLKHFPGHGESGADSHHAIPETPVDFGAWKKRDAPPFQAGIAAGAEVVMMGHLAYSAVDGLPASLSPAWHRVLRDDLGFDGVIVSDDMSMLLGSGLPEYADPYANAIAALAAGTDLVLEVNPPDLGTMVTAIADAVRAGTLPAARLDDAALRVLELRRELWLQQQS